MQALFALPSFRNHVKNFETHIPDEVIAVRSIKQLFRDMEAKSTNLLQTHAYLMSLCLPNYIEHNQFDAEECMTFIINLFYPRVNEPGNPRHNEVPDGCMFLLDGEESILCFNCNKHINSKFRESLCQIEFPEYYNENSVQRKIEEMTNNPYGETLEDLYKCENCRPTKPDGTEASRARTLMNLNKYMIVQLKTFGYDRMSRQPFKKIPKLHIEEQVDTILLGKLNLSAIVYHIGDSPAQGHYVTSVRNGDTWYTCNDTTITLGVKLNCDPANEHDLLIPYLLIYEKDHESLISIPSHVSCPPEIQGDPMIINVDNNDIDFSAECSQMKRKVELVNTDIKILPVDMIPSAHAGNLESESKESVIKKHNPREERANLKRPAHEMEDADEIKKFNPHDRKMSVSMMNRDSLLKELDTQSKKINYAENQRKKKNYY